MPLKGRRLFLIIAVGIVALILTEQFGPGGRQRRALKAAENFRQQILPTIKAESRFANIEMMVSTNMTLGVHGDVINPRDLEDLVRLTKPPVDAPFRVVILVRVME